LNVVLVLLFVRGSLPLAVHGENGNGETISIEKTREIGKFEILKQNTKSVLSDKPFWLLT
jgi:hypothetical protein